MINSALPLIGTLLGGGIIWRALMYRPDRDSVIAAGSAEAVTALREALSELKLDLATLRVTNAELTVEVRRLQARISELEAV